MENSKTKIDRIRSQQIREFCGIQPVNEWVESRRIRRRRREWDEHVTRMDAERLVKISRHNITCRKKIFRTPKMKRNLIPGETNGTAYNKERRRRIQVHQ